MMERKQRIRLCWTAALARAAGCTTESGESMVILQNQVPEAGCVIPGGATPTFRSRGVIDVESGDGYVFTPVVQSRVEGDDRLIAVRGADVELTFPEGDFSADEGLTRFSQAFSGTIEPGGSAGFGFIIIPRGLLDRIGDDLGSGGSMQVTAEVVVFGDLNGGDVESVPFIYPVDVCEGCLKIDNGDCGALPEGFEPSQGGECNLLQDAIVDCCTAGGTEFCPAPA
jgi:hypothetical protein